METYNLPAIVTVDGTYNITITSPTGITMPTYQTVKSLGKLIKIASINPQESEIPRMTIRVMQDDGGFWVGILYVASTFFIALTEADSVERFLFAGKVELESVNWISDSNISGVRTGEIEFTLLSLLRLPFDLATEDWIDEVLLNDIHFATPLSNDRVWHVMSVRGLFSAMLSKSALNPSYLLSDTEFVAGTNKDFLFKTGGNDRDVSQLYIPTKYKDSGGDLQICDYFKDGETLYFPDHYATLRDFISMIIKNFGLRIVLYYDMDDDRYKFKLLQSYRAYDTTLDFGTRLKEETQTTSTDLIGDACRAIYFGESTYFVWISQRYTRMEYYTVDPPTGVEFDYDETCIWHITPGTADGSPERLLSHETELAGGEAASVIETIDGVEWRKYSSSGTETATDPSSHNLKLEQALVGYNGARIIRGTDSATPGWFKNISKYYSITAEESGLESFSNIEILKRQSLSLGFGAGSKNYFANKISIDLDASEVEIEWIQEEL